MDVIDFLLDDIVIHSVSSTFLIFLLFAFLGVELSGRPRYARVGVWLKRIALFIAIAGATTIIIRAAYLLFFVYGAG